MANRRVSSIDNPLVRMHIRIPADLKSSIEDLSRSTGKSISALIREWAAAQIPGHNAGPAGIRERKRLLEEQVHDPGLRLAGIDTGNKKIEDIDALRKSLIEEQVEDLFKALISIHLGDFSKIRKAIRARVEGIKSRHPEIDPPVSEQDITGAVIARAAAAGEKLHGL